jgi:hypothetical protein
MATLTLEIENKKLKFFKDLIQNFSFVHVQEVDFQEDTDKQVIENIKSGLEEMKLIEQGVKKSRPAREFLKEL